MLPRVVFSGALRDVRMRQTRQKTPLALEAILPGAANERDVEEFDAARPSNRPSQRRANQTEPMPPWPICDSKA